MIYDPEQLAPDWENPNDAHHNVRVLCDRAGLTYYQKNVLTACVAVESQFNNQAGPCENKDKVGRVWSRDWGIVQCNDYFHIEGYGKGHDFPSVEYVLANPEVMVNWMIRYYKVHGHLNAWSSYTSGAYKQYL